MSEARAISLLSHYLFFQDISIRDIYQIRLALEPELAASLAGRVSPEDMARLRASLESYADTARDEEEERQQHLDSLNFHLMLAELSGGNPLLCFIIRFTTQVLSDLTIYRRLYEPPRMISAGPAAASTPSCSMPSRPATPRRPGGSCTSTCCPPRR